MLVREQGFAYADRDVAVVNICLHFTLAQLRAYRQVGTIGVPELMDPYGLLARRVGVWVVPQVLFIPATGVVTSSLTGPLTEQGVLQGLRDLLDF